MLNDLLSKIKQAEKKITDITEQQLRPAREELRRCQQKYAEEVCPFSVGDTISDGVDDITISRIVYGYSSGFELYGHKTKKNGEPYKNESHIWSFRNYDKWKIVER